MLSLQKVNGSIFNVKYYYLFFQFITIQAENHIFFEIILVTHFFIQKIDNDHYNVIIAAKVNIRK